MAMKIGICKLCLQEKPLLKKSHIIPDFVYRDGNLYHPGHKLKMIELGAALQGRLVQSGSQSDGVYDKYILCDCCDRQIIGSLESYVKPVLYGEDKVGIKGDRKKVGDSLLLTNINYLKMKLFFFSILWRSSLSKQPFFKDINIRPAAMEKLRKMILNNEINDHESFPLLFLTCSDKQWSQSLLAPLSGDKRTSLFVLPRISFITTRNMDNLELSLRTYRISPIGEMRFKIMSKAEFIELLRTVSPKN